MAWVSIAGLYAYDNTMFDNMVLPDGIDKDTLVFNLLCETAEMEVVYPNPAFMKSAVTMWSKKNLESWNKMSATTKLEYNPIENYDRMEEWNDQGNAVSRVAGYNESELVKAGDGDTYSTHKGRTHGNIGVTTSQQMIEEERRVAQFNMYDYIVQDFKRRFCVMVY